MMKTKLPLGKLLLGIALVLVAISILLFMNMNKKEKNGYIGKTDITIENGIMTPEALLAFGRLSDPQVSPNGEYILYGVNYTDIKQNKSCRNLYVCKLDGSDNQQITFFNKSISNARWSADGKKIYYLKGGQLYSSSLSKNWRVGKANKLSNVANGISEFTLSPDQSKIMYVSTVKSNVKTPADCYEDLDKATAYTTDDLMYRHWDHVVTELPHTFITDFDLKNTITIENSVDILAGEEDLYKLPNEPFSGIEQLSWSPDSKFIAYSCKKLSGKRYAFSTNTDIYIYDVEAKQTLKAGFAVTEALSLGRGYDTDPIWSPDGKRLAWISMERDGYEADKQRLMLGEIKYEDGVPQVWGIRELTKDFKYNVSSPMWSDDSKSILFSALTEGLQAIYRLNVNDVPLNNIENSAIPSLYKNQVNCKITRLTGENDWYDFNTPFYIKDNVLYTSWSSMNFPTELVAIRLSDKAEYHPITKENAHILDQLDETKMEARYIKTIDGKDMLTWVLYPPKFDKTKKYPSILICLGGPQGTLSQDWSYRWNYRLMSAQGYIVVLPNRRGTTAFGQEWTEQISGDYPGLNMQDYLVAARELQKEEYIGKMAACGASYGGYSVFYLSGIHENTFDAFIAHAGIFNEEHMYMTTEEMFFPNWDNGGLHECEIDPKVGTIDCPIGPKGDGVTFGGIKQGGSPWSKLPKAVRHYELSPHNLVTKWDTPIMVIHGALDYRVPVDQGMAAYNAAQMMGVPSRLLIFPDENHWILKPQNALMWHREYFKWLDQWCKEKADN